MATCPKCHQPVTTNAVACPSCGLELKAHGHPGIDLHRAEGSAFLCNSCTYHQDDSCTFPKRPKAVTCTLYQDVALANEPRLKAADIYTLPWWRKYLSWIFLGITILVSILLVVL
ncbi:MAG: zinc ribbon domain-containing protein [Cyanobacteria bacterium P01_D01_bin.156]